MKNSKISALLAFAALGLLAAGCDSTPTVHYPITYQIPIGNAQVAGGSGPQNMNVSSTQDVAVEPGVRIYYQVVSPMEITFSVYDKEGPGPGGNLLTQLRGSTLSSAITPSGHSLEFVFAASQVNTGATVQFTISDRPMSPPMMQTAAPTGPMPASTPSPGVTVTPTAP